MSARLTDEQRILRTVTEAQWQRRVVAIAESYGWTHYHPPKAGVRANGSVRTVPAGFPDLVLARGPRLVFIELKRETGKTTDAQNEWLRKLAATSAETYVFRPSDLDDVITTLGRPERS